MVELGAGGTCPLEEQLDGRGRLGIGPARKRRRIHDDHLLAEDAQPLTTRDEHDQLGHGRLQLAHHLANSGEHVLAVVEHDRSAALGEHDRGCANRPEAECSRHALGVRIGTQLSQQGDRNGRPSRASRRLASSSASRSLADAPGTGQRDDCARQGQLLEVAALPLPTDQPPGHRPPASQAPPFGSKSHAQVSESSMAAANAS